MNLFTIPPGAPFLDLIAQAWLRDSDGDPLAASRGLILLPTRRAARGLRDAFLRQTAGRPVLLPRIAPLGGLEEAPLALAGAIDPPPPIDPVRRQAVLARMVVQLDGAFGAPGTADRAWPLAGELARLLDEAAQAEIDLVARLPDAAADGFAEHWQQTLQFLEIVTASWPGYLREAGLADVAARRIALLDAQARAWSAAPPPHRVLVAGTTGGIPAVARLLRVVAGLPNGAVVLPGLDLDLDEASWEALAEGHPQAGMRHLLGAIGATRGDVRAWDGVWDDVAETSRVTLLRRALLPAESLQDWRSTPPPQPQGLFRLQPADQQEEAVAVAMVLRDAIERPGARAALVTPDRDLAVRVAAELLRFGVVVDDSAGEALLHTPSAVFLRLVARVVAESWAPVPLLGLLKHPLAALGLAPAACRAAARELELLALRGPRPAPGATGLRDALGGRDPAVSALLAALQAALAPLDALMAQPDAAPDTGLAAIIAAAEAIAATDAESGPARLWAGEDGAALSERLADILAALPLLPPQPPQTLPGLLDAALDGAVVRSRRALRGRDIEAAGEHPRVFIWGLLEARLQAVDCVVLGGLAEGLWPPATDPGPWLSRPMRLAMGLPSPEERIGQMAHDFVMTCCAAPVAVLSCPRRRDGAPSVPARWLARLDAFLAGGGVALPCHPAESWAAQLDRAPVPRPVSPPAPRPPVAQRPRRLSVTEIETWLRDPYAIYARHVLRLRALQPIEQAVDAADYGSVVHQGLADFLKRIGSAWPADAQSQLRAAMEAALAAAGLRPALAAWWRPRLARIADWVAAEETARRAEHRPAIVAPEVVGEWLVDCPAGPFAIRGRADRIERREGGGLAILDYKTGVPPSQAEVEAGLAPQLPLEAVMADAGAFGPDLRGAAEALIYWHLSGGFVPGEARALFKGDPARVAEAMHTAREKLCALMRDFDDPDRAYLSCPHPGAAPRFSDYAQLARVAEWAAVEGD